MAEPIDHPGDDLSPASAALALAAAKAQRARNEERDAVAAAVAAIEHRVLAEAAYKVEAVAWREHMVAQARSCSRQTATV